MVVESTPSWGRPILAIKWSHREMRVFDAAKLLDHFTSDHDTFGFDDARLTAKGNNISMRKPTLDNCPSANKGRAPWRVVTDFLDVPRRVIQS
jgi:hypothetical protein